MAIIVRTSNPVTLLKAIKAGIEQKHIETWLYDADGDFTHSPEQWRNQAWLRPTLGDGELVLRIMPPVNTRMSRTVYAVYHGRFIEMLLTHFDRSFESARATALPSRGDSVGT